MIFNTHTHFNFILNNPVCPIANVDYLEKFERKNKEEILTQNKEYGVNICCIVGSNELSSINALEVAKMDDSLYCTLGLHPEDHQEEGSLVKIDLILENFEKLIQENRGKIIGIGEIGLDYHYLDKENETHKNRQKEIQKIFFKRQVELANKYNLPVIIHSRDSKDDIFECLKKLVPNKFVVHCFSEDLEFARKILELSLNSFIGFAGMITYKSAENIREVIKNIPLEKILVETDDPFLAPQEFRGQTNYPAYVKLVLNKIKELREEDNKTVEDAIWQNSLNFFNLKNSQI